MPLGCVANVGECIPFARNSVNPGDADGSLGARTDSFRAPWEQIRRDPDFRQVYCSMLRNERIREGFHAALSLFGEYTPLLPI